MRSLLLFLLTCLLSFSLQAQRVLIDRAASGARNARAIEGGSVAVAVDKRASISKLINRLNSRWELVETGKSYWIGYTDDMYSIAAHKDAAIQPLLDFIKNAPSAKAKLGAVYSLHLIGINSRIAGRFYEDFSNPKARTALLGLLTDQDSVMELLLRDPWQADVPRIFTALNQSKGDCWPLVNGITNYQIAGLPLHQRIPAEINGLPIKVPPLKQEGKLFNFHIPYQEQFLGVLLNIRKSGNPAVSIEDTLFHSRLWGNSWTEFEEENSITEGAHKLTLGSFMRMVTEVDYNSLGSRVQYFVSDQQLTICSTATARNRLLVWWNQQSPEMKCQFTGAGTKRVGY